MKSLTLKEQGNMDQKLKDALPQLTLENLAQLDHGKLRKKFSRVFDTVCQNIMEYPVRDGKAEPRKITIELTITGEIKRVKKPLESQYGTTEVEVPEVCGLIVQAAIKDKLPVFETSCVSMAIETKNGRITDARFNQNNNDAPSQLEMPFDDDEPADE